MKSIFCSFIPILLICILSQGTVVLCQPTETANETGFLPPPEKDAFASIQTDLKNSGKRKEKGQEPEKVEGAQPDTPVLDRRDYELYMSVTSLLPDAKAALRQLEEVINGRMALSVEYRPGPVLYYLWGNLKYQLDDYEGALENYEKALEAFPTYRKACLDAGMVANQIGDKEKAIQLLERGLAAEGVIKEPRITNLLADLYYERGSTDEAIQYFQETIEQDTKNLHAHMRLAWIFYQQEDFDRTLEYVLRAISLGGGNRETYLIIASIYKERNKPHAALTALEQARFFDPDSRQLRHFQLGLLDELNRVPEIISLARGLLEEDDTDVDAWRYLADAYARSEQPWEAISAFETLLLLGVKEAEIHLRLATLYADENLPRQGIVELVHALDIPQSRKFSSKILAFTESLLTKVRESEASLLLDAVESWAGFEQTVETQRLLVMMRIRHLLSLDKYEEARDILIGHLDNQPDDALAHLYLGDLESRSGNFIEARIHLDRAASVNEHRADSLLKLGLLELRQGRAKECLDFLAESYSLHPTPQLRRYILKLCRYYKEDPALLLSDL